MNYTVGQMAEMLSAELEGAGHLRNLEIRDHFIDTRKIKGGETGVFWALSGERNDGHKYLHEAYLLGIRAFVISDRNAVPRETSEAVFLVVQDTRESLQKLALQHRHKFDVPTLGITGSNGKTIVKEWLYHLMGPDLKVVKSPKSYNSQIGVPLSVLLLNEEHQLGIFEAGISRPGEMEQIAPIIDPAIVILTNIGPAHDAGFTNRTEKLKEKLKLAAHAATIIYCCDQEDVTVALDGDERAISWGVSEAADFPVKVRRVGNHSVVTFGTQDDGIDFRVPFSDRASIENVCHCLTTMFVLDYDLEAVQRRVLELKNVPMRLEMKYGSNNCTLIDDTYSADIHSLKIALEFLDEQPSLKSRTLILSELRESVLGEDDYIREIIGLAQTYQIKKLVGVGKVFRTYSDKLSTQGFAFRAYSSTEELLEHTGYDSFNNEIILIKGARAFRFERVVQKLQLQSHRTVLEINLNHLVNNLQIYRKFIKEETGVVAMVKAFAYGSGSSEIASVLEKQGVAALAVAFTDEGVKLRQAGIRCPVIVMNAGEDDLSLLIDHHLEPEIYSMAQLDELLGRLQTGTYGDHTLNIHLKLETGMNRLGIGEPEIDPAIEKIKSCAQLRLHSVFSHLAAAEDAAFDTFTFEQLRLYKRLSEHILKAFDHPVRRHILNSAGIVRFTGAQYDWVRLGIGMYGVDASSSIQERLKPVGTLKTRIAQIKTVKKGETIGYGRKGQALNDMKLAVLPVGYADGLDRRLGNGKGEVFIKGKKPRVVGNICMDLTMVDVTFVDHPQPGDEVEIFGPNVSMVDAAARIGTIPYELLTNVSERVKRIYVKD